MALIVNKVNADEKTWQGKFYEMIFGVDYLESEKIKIDRSTDGYTQGIIFEHKQNVRSYGESKALSQALIYLCRFNRDGIPVPAKICLVGQDDKTCYIYDTSNYMDYVNDIEKYANLEASKGIPNFQAGARTEVISFDMNSAVDMQEIIKFVQKAPNIVKVDIDVHNVYGWSNYYYDNASKYKQKAEKTEFFKELRNPVGTLEDCINPWKGKETDFKYINDMLNDPLTQKKLGAFYTPPKYSKKAVELVLKAIERVPDGNDYIILDRCAGTGNLEMYFDDEILSHVIVSTYELQEWIVLKDRFGSRVRYIIPPIPSEKGKFPNRNSEGFLDGSNALTKELMENKVVRSYVENPNCSVILFENPPYVETTGVEFQKKGKGKDSSDWKNTFVVEEMKKEVTGAVSNDMANAFIWSGFKYFLRQDTDSYIVFSPVKYWKSQHLIQKKFMGGFAFNKRHFHASSDACIMCAYWSNEEDKNIKELNLKAMNIDSDNRIVDEGNVNVKSVQYMFSDKLFDNRSFDTDVKDGVLVGLDGKETNVGRVKPIYNPNIIAYCSAHAFGFDNPRLTGQIHTATRFNGNGFYVRKDNFMEKLPLFAASRYTDNYNDWKVMSMIMKTADGSVKYKEDIENHKLDDFLFKTMFWTCVTHYSHMRSFEGSDGRYYKNELCFDGDTLANAKLREYLNKGNKLTLEEQKIFNKIQGIYEWVKTNCRDEYNPKYHYGLYQIDEEINIKVQVGINADGTPKMGWKYGDLNVYIKDIKTLIKNYYLKELVDTLFAYEFLK